MVTGNFLLAAANWRYIPTGLFETVMLGKRDKVKKQLNTTRRTAIKGGTAVGRCRRALGKAALMVYHECYFVLDITLPI